MMSNEPEPIENVVALVDEVEKDAALEEELRNEANTAPKIPIADAVKATTKTEEALAVVIPLAEEAAKADREAEAEIKELDTPISTKTTMKVNRMYKKAGIITHEEENPDTIEINIPVAGVTMAQVGAASRMTLNMGSFESVQLEVSITLPCFPEETQECYRAAKHLVDVHLNEEVKMIREYRDSKKSS